MPTTKTNPSQTPQQTRKPAVEPASKPQPEITAMQDLLCDLAGDLIMNGGDRQDSEPFLRALARHQWRLRFPNYPIDAEQRDKRTGDDEERSFDEWFRKYTAGLPDNPREVSLPEVRKDRVLTITDRIRDNIRQHLAERMAEFLRRASPEDLSLMREVLMFWGCNGGPLQAGYDVQSIVLADAMENEIQRHETDGTYIRVPEEFVPIIIQMVRQVRRTAA